MDKQYWDGSPIKTCDACHAPIKIGFVDGKLPSGPWAIVCLNCYIHFGMRVGAGFGQMYREEPDGKWIKVAG
jgi:hypothetical protein